MSANMQASRRAEASCEPLLLCIPVVLARTTQCPVRRALCSSLSGTESSVDEGSWLICFVPISLGLQDFSAGAVVESPSVCTMSMTPPAIVFNIMQCFCAILVFPGIYVAVSVKEASF